MASTAVTAPPVIGGDGVTKMTALEANSTRIAAVMQRLAIFCRTQIADELMRKEFAKLCLSFSRGLDYAFANDVVPDRAQELPSLLSQICRSYGDDRELQCAIMTLLFSVKGACKSGWYADRDIEEVMKLVNEIGSKFGTVSPLFNEPSSHHHSVISTIMSRFYPRQKMGQIFAFADAKPGYGAYLSDFQILKNFRGAPGEKLSLFVVQTDSVETSSCLITPPRVNFLLNGKPVEKRTSNFRESGPQIPTVMRQYLQYGSNLLQAVGEFDGNYIIAMALMSQLPSPGCIGLQDHVPATLDSDPDIIEGPFRISLNCPISFTRIQTPVKGHLCKHIQCFDFDNYVDMNSRCPSWRCPHCNKPVCFTDLRIDQKIVKILKEIGPNVNHIIVSSDGTWQNAMGTDDATQKPDGKTSNSGENDTENVSLPTSPVNVLDLTGTDDAMDVEVTHETEDRKFDPVVSQNESLVPSTNTSYGNDDFWSGIYRSTFVAGSSNVQQNTNYGGSPLVLESSISSVPNREIEVFLGNGFATAPVAQREYQYDGNPAITSEYGTLPQLQPSNVAATPVAVQALPSMQTPYPATVPRSRSTPNTFMRQNSLPTASQGPLPSPANMNTTSRSSSQNPHLSSPALSQYPGLQRNAGLPHGYRTSREHQMSSQRMGNNRMPPATNQSPRHMQSPSVFKRPQSHVGVSSQNSQLLAAANRAVHMSLDSSGAVSPYSGNNPTAFRMPFQGDQRVNAGVTSQPLTRTNSFDTADPNWRPAARMRGALTGQAYSDAMNQFIIRPTQQAQAHAARPVSNVASLPVNVQSRLADRATQGSPASAGPSSSQGM